MKYLIVAILLLVYVVGFIQAETWKDRCFNPVPLAHFGVNNDIILNETTVSLLQTLPPPLYIDSSMGVFRGHKSTAMTLRLRHLLSNDTRTWCTANFEAKRQVVGVTKGIWVWYTQMEDGKGTRILIDTQGTDDPNLPGMQAVRIMQFVALGTSHINYHVRQNVELSNLQKLGTIIAWLKLYKDDLKLHNVTTLDIASLDFIVGSGELFNLPENSIDASQYLRENLEDKGAAEDESRKLIREFFPQASLFVCAKASEGELENFLYHITTTPGVRGTGKSPFCDSYKLITERIYQSMKPKAIDSVELDGYMWVQYLKTAVSLINNGVVEGPPELFLQRLCEDEFTRSLATVETKKRSVGRTFPTTSAYIELAKADVTKETIDVFDTLIKKMNGKHRDYCNSRRTTIWNTIETTFQLLSKENIKADEAAKLLKQPYNVDQLQHYFTNVFRSDIVQAIGVNINPTQFFASNKDLEIRAHTVTFTGKSMVLPGRSVKIHAVEIHVPSEGFEIDVSGKNGFPDYSNAPAAYNRDGNIGGDGSHAGSINITALNISGGLLKLTANGGNGGRGQNGGNGQNGEGGGLCQDGSPGKSGYNGGQSGKGGNGGSVFFSSVTHKDIPVKLSVLAGMGGSATAGGNGGQGGPGGGCTENRRYIQGCCWTRERWFDTVCVDCWRDNWVSVTKAAGPFGPIGRAGLSGRNGHPGQVSLKKFNATSALSMLGTQYTTMMLRFGEAQYLNNDPSTPTTFSHIAEVSSALGDVLLLERATSVILQLRDGLDYYGQELNYIPTLSFDRYMSHVKEMLVIAELFNKHLTIALNENKTQAEREQNAKQAMSQAKIYLDDYSKRIGDIVVDTADLNQKLTSTNDIYAARYDNLMNLENEEHRQVLQKKADELHAQRVAQNSVGKKKKFNIGSLLEIVSQFVPLGAQVWGAVNTFKSTVSTGLGSLGVPVPPIFEDSVYPKLFATSNTPEQLKKSIKTAKKIYQVGKNVKNSWEEVASSWDELKNTVVRPPNSVSHEETNVGEESVSIPEVHDLPILMATWSQYKKFIGDIPSVDFKDAFEDFAAVAKTQNFIQMSLKSLDNAYTRTLSEQRGLANDLENYNNLLRETDQQLLNELNFLLCLKHDYALHIQQILHVATRALLYESLSSYNLPSLAYTDLVHFNDYYGRLLQARLLAEQSIGQEKQLFYGVNITFSKAQFPHLFSELAQFGHTVINLPIDHNSFKGKCHVHVSKVSVHLNGLSLNGQTSGLEGFLLHSGTAVSVAKYNGQVLIFNHQARQMTAPINTKYGSELQTNLGNSEKFLELSPFTTWSLKFANCRLPECKIDMRNVDHLTLLFDGSFLSSDIDLHD